MSPEKEKEIYEACPHLFTAPVRGGLCVGDGWFEIFMQMCKDIEEILMHSPNTLLTIGQVKTKFGDPRIYFSVSQGGVTAEMRRIINQAKIRMYNTCELCGASGEHDNTQILCPGCRGKRRRPMKIEKLLNGVR